MSNLLDGPQQPKKEQRQNKGGIVEVKSLIESKRFSEQLAAALPKHITPARFTRVLLTQLNKNADLAKCEQTGLFAKILECAAVGLEPDGRQAHLIPRWNTKKGHYEATLVIDYKGYVELMYRGGFVNRIHADVIYEGDIFVYELGLVLKHVPWHWRKDSKKPMERGAVLGAYCMIFLKDADPKCEVMTEDEIQDIRRRSASPEKGPWVTDTNEMRKKSPFRRAQKWIPLSSEYRDKIDKDDDNVIDVTPTTLDIGETITGQRAIEQQQTEPARIEYVEEPAEGFIPEVVAEPMPVADNVAEEKPQRSRKKQEPFAELGDGQL